MGSKKCNLPSTDERYFSLLDVLPRVICLATERGNSSLSPIPSNMYYRKTGRHQLLDSIHRNKNDIYVLAQLIPHPLKQRDRSPAQKLGQLWGMITNIKPALVPVLMGGLQITIEVLTISMKLNPNTPNNCRLVLSRVRIEEEKILEHKKEGILRYAS